MKQYIIPHNYKDNGRVLNLFPAKQLTRALIVAVPLTLLIFNLPLALNAKLFCEVFFVTPPVFAILMGYADWLVWGWRFLGLRKIFGKGGASIETAKIYSRAADARIAHRH
jgi:hypothetical protein